jgi:hypothetical protein
MLEVEEVMVVLQLHHQVQDQALEETEVAEPEDQVLMDQE